MRDGEGRRDIKGRGIDGKGNRERGMKGKGNTEGGV